MTFGLKKLVCVVAWWSLPVHLAASLQTVQIGFGRSGGYSVNGGSMYLPVSIAECKFAADSRGRFIIRLPEPDRIGQRRDATRATGSAAGKAGGGSHVALNQKTKPAILAGKKR